MPDFSRMTFSSHLVHLNPPLKSCVHLPRRPHLNIQSTTNAQNHIPTLHFFFVDNLLHGYITIWKKRCVDASVSSRLLEQPLANNFKSKKALSSLKSQVLSWKSKLPLQTIMRLLQVLVPQVEKICIDK